MFNLLSKALNEITLDLSISPKSVFQANSKPFSVILSHVSVFFVLLLLVSTYSELFNLSVFGYDEVHYYQDFSFKLIEDGRWLNFLLHEFMRSIPLKAWAFIYLFISWVLFFKITRDLEFDSVYAALISSTILLSYPFVEQSLWPATTAPSIIILLCGIFLAEREVPPQIIYIVCGVFIFGTMQNFYFLLPLFFLKSFFIREEDAPKPWVLFCKHMWWWVAGAIAGVFVMSIALWIMTGNFGVQPASWRQIQPIKGIDDLLRNLLFVIDAYLVHFSRTTRIAQVQSFLYLSAVGLILLVRFRTLLSNALTFILLSAVMTSFFAFSVPLAPVIQSRSLIAMVAGFVFFIAILPGSSKTGRTCCVLLMIPISYGFFMHGVTYLRDYKNETNFFYSKISELIPGYPTKYSAIAVIGEMNGNMPESRIFNSPPIMHGIMHALGIEDYRDCRQGLDPRCDNLLGSEPISILPFVRGDLFFSINQDNIGIIEYSERNQGH